MKSDSSEEPMKSDEYLKKLKIKTEEHIINILPRPSLDDRCQNSR